MCFFDIHMHRLYNDNYCACHAEVPLDSMMGSEDIDSSFDASSDVAAASLDDDMEAVAAEPRLAKPAVAIKPSDEAVVQMEAEAASKGYGKAYAAFGGGKEGLEACAACELP